MRSILALTLFAAVAACGGADGDDGDDPIDAAAVVPDADPAAPDADPAAPDAEPAPDATPSSVLVIDCPTTPDATVVTAGSAYSPQSTTIAVGDTVRFTMGPSHNAQSGAPGAPTDDFLVGFGDDVCLHFTAVGTYPFYCTPHSFTGSIVVE